MIPRCKQVLPIIALWEFLLERVVLAMWPTCRKIPHTSNPAIEEGQSQSQTMESWFSSAKLCSWSRHRAPPSAIAAVFDHHPLPSNVLVDHHLIKGRTLQPWAFIFLRSRLPPA
eukprot:scaffold5966_cov118-Cylindrotheca_fusiformis.AAC.31